jgi:hypothetical protein
MNNENKERQVGIPSLILRKIKRLIPKSEEKWVYRTTKEYWDTMYTGKFHGGTSGVGSIGENRIWKWKHIEEYVDVSKRSVLDIGCGDLSFWDGRNCVSYTGLDFSPVIIERCKKIRPDWTFIQGDASSEHDFTGEVVFCFDMLFHILSDETYIKIIGNLAKWTQKWLFIYTWHKSKFGDSPTDGKYQYYRPLLNSLHLFAPLQLVDSIQHDEYGTLYVFTRIDD